MLHASMIHERRHTVCHARAGSISPSCPSAGTPRADWGAAHVNPDADLLWASLAVPVLLRLMQLRPLTQTQAQQALGTSVPNEHTEGIIGEGILMEAADIASALERVSAVGCPSLQPFLGRHSSLKVPYSHRIRLATALTQQVSSCNQSLGGNASPDVYKQVHLCFSSGTDAASRHLAQCLCLTLQLQSCPQAGHMQTAEGFPLSRCRCAPLASGTSRACKSSRHCCTPLICARQILRGR